MLSRRRLLSIFQEFREKRAKNRLRNPFDWPVLDTFIKFENKLEAAIPPLLTKENTKITIGESVPDDIKPSLKTSIKDVIDLHADEAALAMAIPSVKEEAKSETTKQALTQKEPEQNKELDVTELLSEKNEKINAPESNQENPTPPQTAGTPKSVRSSSENADKTSDTDQADKNAIDTSRIEPLPLVDSLVSARPQTSTMTSLSNPVRPVITKNNELRKLKFLLKIYTNCKQQTKFNSPFKYSSKEAHFIMCLYLNRYMLSIKLYSPSRQMNSQLSHPARRQKKAIF